MDYEILKPINSPKQSSKKSKKPLMEKMRRARINDSLNELKELVLDALKKDASRYSKMEKADILEMTVKYLKTLHRNRRSPPKDDEALARYRAGYNECASEVSRYLMTAENVNERLQTQILSHLASSYTQSEQSAKEQSESRVTMLPPVTAMTDLPTIFPTSGHFNVLPSPPSSPLKARDKALLGVTASAPVVIGNRVPAILLPSDARLHLLPFSLQRPIDAAVWRPW